MLAATAESDSVSDTLTDTRSAADSQPQPSPPQFKRKMSKEEIEARKLELEAQIRELERKRAIELEKREKLRRLQENLHGCIPMDMKSIIAKYERYLNYCADNNNKSDRCADVIYNLVLLYCESARQECAANSGCHASDNAKAIDMYRQLIREYPNFEKIYKAKKELDSLLQLQNK
jgi:hypothetical protein